MIKYHLFERKTDSIICRSGGMADAADSKSAVGDYVWVQLPSSALRPLNFEMNSKVIFFLTK